MGDLKENPISSKSDAVLGADVLNPYQISLVCEHLKTLFESPFFANSRRARDFLELIVGHALAGEFDSLSERMIGVEMFNRPVDYDTANDSIVRVKATEIRKKLALYYEKISPEASVRIELPVGGYIPEFHFIQASPQDANNIIEIKRHVAYETTSPSLASEESCSLVSQPHGMHWTDSEPAVSKDSPGRISRADHNDRDRRARWKLIGTRMFLVVLIVVCGVSAWLVVRKRFVVSNTPTIAVLPFENLSADPNQEYLANGITEELIESLGQVSTLRVISRTSTMTFKGSHQDLPQIAHALGADDVVEGSILRDGNQFRLNVRLIDARTDQVLWEHAYNSDLSDVLAVQGEMAEAISEGVRVKLTPPIQAQITRQRSVNRDAEDLYLRGEEKISENDFREAIRLFQAAIAADPNSAQSHAALAYCYGWMGEAGQLSYEVGFKEQKDEALRAIQLDESLSDGHLQLANALMDLDWNWEGAAKEFHRALELNSNSVNAHERYSVLLEREGRRTESLAESEKSLSLDPVSQLSYIHAAWTFYFEREYGRASSVFDQTRLKGINESSVPFLQANLLVEKHQFAEAIHMYETFGDSPHVLGHLGNAFAREGETVKAREVISQLERHVRESGIGQYEIALVYTGLGDNEDAFRWLNEAFNHHNEGLTNVLIDPCLDPLRSDNRFLDLVRRIGLNPVIQPPAPQF